MQPETLQIKTIVVAPLWLTYYRFFISIFLASHKFYFLVGKSAFHRIVCIGLTLVVTKSRYLDILYVFPSLKQY